MALRVVSLNLWNEQHEPSLRVATAIQGLRALAPDVLGLQEVIDSRTIGNTAETIARALGPDYRVTFDQVDHHPAHHTGPCGNAIVSRFPVLKTESMALPSGDEDPRRVLYTLLATPDGELPFFTTHLSWEMWVAPRRETQVVALDTFVKAHAGDLPAVITGDFNTPPDSAVWMFMTGRMGLAGQGTYYRDAFARRHPREDGFTWAAKNPHVARWIERDRRIDYVFVGQLRRSDGWGAVLDARVVLDLPGPDGAWASDHFGVYAELGVAPERDAV